MDLTFSTITHEILDMVGGKINVFQVNPENDVSTALEFSQGLNNIIDDHVLLVSEITLITFFAIRRTRLITWVSDSSIISVRFSMAELMIP